MPNLTQDQAILDIFDSTTSHAWGCGMLLYGKCLTPYLICLKKVVWEAFYPSLLYKSSQMILKSLK